MHSACIRMVLWLGTMIDQSDGWAGLALLLLFDPQPWLGVGTSLSILIGCFWPSETALICSMMPLCTWLDAVHVDALVTRFVLRSF
jgi:hypothetical protein